MTAWLETIPARGNTAPDGVSCTRLQAAAPGATGQDALVLLPPGEGHALAWRT